MSESRICSRCDRLIEYGGYEVVRHSASGVRPNDWVHDPGDLACRPITAADPR
ncbi:hypothetical protein [Streptomyces erythrochromogenes]|uniref:hypothetical protein n=1 Tax=Streptomyces erythrochromogenes TaxID=285574 RepID=UPI0002FA196F